MSINIKIDSDITPEAAKEATKPIPDAVISLEARKTLDGKIMILDHVLIDIVLDTVGKKIVSFPKENLSDDVYVAQSAYFRHLQNDGIIIPESVIAGNVYGSLEALYPDAVDEGISAAQVVLLSTKKFIDQENPQLKAQEFFEKEVEDYMVEPTPEDSTGLGEVPQEPKKGSISPDRIRRYLSGYGYY